MRKSPKGSIVVHIEQDSRVIDLHETCLVAILADDEVGALLRAEAQEFFEERAAEENRMAALALMGGDREGRARRSK